MYELKYGRNNYSLCYLFNEEAYMNFSFSIKYYLSYWFYYKIYNEQLLPNNSSLIFKFSKI